jgi:predicted nucleotidyltransferase
VEGFMLHSPARLSGGEDQGPHAQAGRALQIKSLCIFGSYVRGEAKGTSDVDLLVEFSESPDIFKFMDLEEELAALLG